MTNIDWDEVVDEANDSPRAIHARASEDYLTIVKEEMT